MSYDLHVRRALLGWVANYVEVSDRIDVGPDYGWWRPTRAWAIRACRRHLRRHERRHSWQRVQPDDQADAA